jgi:hypothetical protein
LNFEVEMMVIEQLEFSLIIRRKGKASGRKEF